MNEKNTNRNTNAAELSGIMAAGPEYSHSSDEKKYYRIYIESRRLSSTVDRIPVLVPDHLLSLLPQQGGKIHVTGRFISYNEKTGHLKLHLYADEINPVGKESTEPDSNAISLRGYICMQPAVRTTPMGRKIAEVMLAVNRQNRRSDYIPCIAWGNNALLFEDAEIGEMVSLKGRIQSRWYVKRLDEDEYEERIAYEVSMSHVNFPEREAQNPGRTDT